MNLSFCFRGRPRHCRAGLVHRFFERVAPLVTTDVKALWESHQLLTKASCSGIVMLQSRAYIFYMTALPLNLCWVFNVRFIGVFLLLTSLATHLPQLASCSWDFAPCFCSLLVDCSANGFVHHMLWKYTSIRLRRWYCFLSAIHKRSHIRCAPALGTYSDIEFQDFNAWTWSLSEPFAKYSFFMDHEFTGWTKNKTWMTTFQPLQIL